MNRLDPHPRRWRCYLGSLHPPHGPSLCQRPQHRPRCRRAQGGCRVLSHYIRRRLVLEQDAVAAALAAHGPESAEKFVQEVIWRGYFKGWLERRPQIWRAMSPGWRPTLLPLTATAACAGMWSARWNGQTGLECFDAWATELIDTGYLHNHARMWFASIWIFTLGLPWRLGADFFYRHLLDGDAASQHAWLALGRRAAHTRQTLSGGCAEHCGPLPPVGSPRGGPDLAEVTQGLEATEPEGCLPSCLCGM